jgi:outer membrane protein assembly factor BamB
MRLVNRVTTTTAAAAMLAALAIPAASAVVRPDQTYINWPSYLYGVTHSSYNAAATAITTTTAPDLTTAWKWHPPAGTMTGQPAPALFSSPTVYDGVVYIGSHTGEFYALNETTGAVLWSDFLGFVTKSTCGATGISDTATVATDPNTGVLTVYVSGGAGYLYALNAATGATIWQSLIATQPPGSNSYYDWASPTIANGNIYIGVSSQCGAPEIHGSLNMYDQTTGALLKTWATGPATAKSSASIWSSATVDSSGNVFTSTGSGLGKLDSIVELNGTKLTEMAHWQVPPDQRIDDDSDFGGSTTIWTADIGGTSTEMVGACNKNGTYYALEADDLDAGPVWQDALGAGNTEAPECDAAAIWNGTNLFLSGPPTTIGGVSYGGSIEEVNPATGAPIWQTGLNGTPIGTPSLDGSDVLAVQCWEGPDSYLINATTGAILSTLITGSEWGQPTFADGYLFFPTRGKGLWALTNPAEIHNH